MAKKENEIEVTVAEVVDYLRLNGQFAPALREVVTRKVTAQAAKKKGMKVTTKQLQKAADAFRLANGLTKARDTERWLKANGISVDALEDYLETNFLINNLKDRLNKTTGKTKYANSPGIKGIIREMIYQDWINDQLR